MKKLGILGVLVLLVALAFVPQGVMAAPTDNGTLTINAGVQHAIELSVDAENETSATEYNQDETYNRLDFNPNEVASPVRVGTLEVLSNFGSWDVKVKENAFETGEKTNIADGKMYNFLNETILASNLQIRTVSVWNAIGSGTPATMDVLTDVTGSDKSIGLVGAPHAKTDGVYIPIEVQQAVTYDDLVGDYTIVLEFSAGKY